MIRSPRSRLIRSMAVGLLMIGVLTLLPALPAQAHETCWSNPYKPFVRDGRVVGEGVGWCEEPHRATCVGIWLQIREDGEWDDLMDGEQGFYCEKDESGFFSDEIEAPFCAYSDNDRTGRFRTGFNIYTYNRNGKLSHRELKYSLPKNITC